MADQTKIGIIAEMRADDQSISRETKKFKRAAKIAEDAFKQVGIDWKKISKFATSATSEIQAISDSAETFAKELGSATMESVGQLQKLGDQLDNAKKKAIGLAQKWGKAEGPAQAEIGKDLEAASDQVSKYTQDIVKQRKEMAKGVQQLTRLIKVQDKYQKKVSEASKFDTGDMLSSIKDKISSGNFKGIFSDLGNGIQKSIQGSIARKGEAKAAAAGGAGTPGGKEEIAGAAMKMEAAGLALGAAVAGFAIFVKLIMDASDHMAKLNKALLHGSMLAGDLNTSTVQYSQSIDDLRNAAINSAGSMLKLGAKSEDSLKIVAAFSREASGSIVKTAANLKDIGGGSLEYGMQQFATNAIVYGKSLGMEAEETAGLMGKFVSEIGVGVANVQSTFDIILKQAVQANMPVSKFMDIFKQTVPSIDLYTNRMEELTGVIKMLSKTMSAKDVKGFMDAFGKGFDKLDFKQRLKMVLLVGPQKVGATLQKGFDDSTKTIAKQLGEFGPAFEKGMKEADPVKATRKIMGRAMAVAGTDPNLAATLGDAAKLARAQRLKNKGDPLSMAGAMRGASMYARTSIMEDFAKSLGQDIEGLGEHVVKQLGVTEEEYKAILALQDNMGAYTSQAREVGRTSSKSINDQLKVLLGIKDTGEAGEIEFEKQMKQLAANDPKGLEDKIKRASSMQFESDDKNKKTAQELAVIQSNATLSIGEKIDNIIKVLLEKIFQALSGITSLIDKLYGWMIGGKDNVKLIQEMEKSTSAFEAEMSGKEGGKERTDYVTGVANQAMKMVNTGVSGGEILKATGAEEHLKTLKPEDLRRFLQSQGVRTASDIDQGSGESTQLTDAELLAKLPEILKNVSSTQGARMAQGIAMDKAREGGFAPKSTEYKQGKETQKLEAEEQDARTSKLMSDVIQKENVQKAYGGKGEPTPDHVSTSPKSTGATPATAPQTRGGTSVDSSKDVDDMLRKMGIPPALKEHAAANLGVAPGAVPGGPEAKTDPKAPDTMIDLLAAIKTASESVNTQVMGVSMHIDDIRKFMKGAGIHLNAGKFDTDVVKGSFQPVLEKTLAAAFLDYFLYSADSKQVNAVLDWGKKNEAKTVQEATQKYSESWAPFKEFEGGMRDFGGKIDATGYYRLMKGEEVVNPSLNGGGGKSVMINATINVNGAQDAKAVAEQIRATLYNMTEKQ